MAFLGRLMARIRGSEYVEGSVQDWLDECAARATERYTNYTLFEEYYDGKQRAQPTARAAAFLEQSGLPFCENFCEPVVDALAERLEVIGFSTSLAGEQKVDGGKTEMVDPLADEIEEWWAYNRMDGVQATVHTQSLMKADAYVIVDYDTAKSRPRFTFNRPHQISVKYSDDEPDVIEYATKVWNSNAKGPSNPNGARVTRLNIYFDDHVEKWFRLSRGGEGGSGGGWAHWHDEPAEGEPSVWPLDWKDKDGQPLGVPVFHFRHKPLGDHMGRSRLRAVLPFQDELNKLVLDLNMLCDNHGMPQRWVTGHTGDGNLTTVAGALWKAAGSDTVAFGQFDAADTSNLINAIEACLSRMARRSRTPLHLLTGGTPPSGEALKTSESGLVASAKQAQLSYGRTWEDAVALAVKLAADQGVLQTALPDDWTITTQWENPETRSDQSDLQVAEAKLRIGFSKATVIAELGGDPEKEAERKAIEDAAAADAQGALFDRGGLPV